MRPPSVFTSTAMNSAYSSTLTVSTSTIFIVPLSWCSPSDKSVDELGPGDVDAVGTGATQQVTEGLLDLGRPPGGNVLGHRRDADRSRAPGANPARHLRRCFLGCPAQVRPHG